MADSGLPPAGAALQQTRHNRIGIVWMVLAMSAFMGNDTIMKGLGAHLPAAQLIVVRGVMAIALITAVAWRLGALGRLNEVLRGSVVLRAVCEGLGTLLYLAALFHLPLANATAINLSSPLFLAVLARLMLGERVDAVRWFLILTGFAGVLLVIQPRADGFNMHAWLALLATLIYAGRDMLVRRIAASTPSILVTLATAVGVWLMALFVLVFEGWVSMPARDVGLLAIASVFLSTGYYAMIAALRHAEVSVVAPFRYVGLLWALVLGFVVWGDVPNPLAWVGIVLLLVSGLVMVRRQRAPAAPRRATG